MDEYVFYGAIGNKQVRYKFENADLFQSTVKLQKLYKASNPDEPLKLDLIINSDIDRITAVAISPKK
jgi:hypothetical protein